jgi:hypothetical protein
MFSIFGHCLKLWFATITLPPNCVLEVSAKKADGECKLAYAIAVLFRLDNEQYNLIQW